ncbi:hypothetical protein [Bacteroides cellulosilyticus]|uniref:hypothetical protein n=1 Tax=Bacteroides cellulosilyticus TaxID=246787 RepID=UPI0035638FC6
MELKKRMTYEEMAEYFEYETGKLATKSGVGKYAKQIGFEVYKPHIDGKKLFFYVNPNIGKYIETAGSEKQN